MRMLLAKASLALLAACGGGAANNSSNVAAPANGVRADRPLPTDPELLAMRAGAVRRCTEDVSLDPARSATAPRLCGCAVDRLMEGKTAEQLRRAGGGREREAIDACAAELGIAVPSRPVARTAPAAPKAGNSTE
jgi:hypothetical protein